MIFCKKWSENNINGGGLCALGLFGGNPSEGICKKCMKNPEWAKQQAKQLDRKITEQYHHALVAKSKLLSDNIKKEMPPLREQVKNVIASKKAIKNAVTNEPVLVDEEIREGREEICEKCKYLQNGRCTKCGCFLAMKLILVTEKCPIGKWN